MYKEIESAKVESNIADIEMKSHNALNSNEFT